MEQPLVSIVIPVYNAERFLDECYQSIEEQLYDNIEIIFINDGSTDSSYQKCCGYKATDHRVKVLSQENAGQNSARKAGVNIAKGRYICFVDADDFIDKNMLIEMVNKAEEYDAQIVKCGTYKLYEDGETQPEYVKAKIKGLFSGKEIAEKVFDKEDLFRLQVSVSLWGAIFDREIIKRIMWTINEKIDYSEDYLCAILAMLDSNNVYVIENNFYYYRCHRNSFCHVHTKDNYNSQKLLFSSLKTEFNKRKVSDEMYQQLNYMIIRDLLLGGYNYYLNNYDFLFPYPNVKRGSKIVIYGAGVFGTEMYSLAVERNDYEVVAWVDKKWETYNDSRITSIDHIKDNFDYIVVAVIKHSITMQIKKDLMAFGINEQKIATICEDLFTEDNIPEAYKR